MTWPLNLTRHRRGSYAGHTADYPPRGKAFRIEHALFSEKWPRAMQEERDDGSPFDFRLAFQSV